MTELTPAQSAAIDAAGIGFILLCSLGAGLFCGVIGAFIGSFKNRKALGLFLGITFGVLGWLFTLFAREGDQEEGVFDAFAAIVGGILFNALLITVSWHLFVRPLINAGVEAVKKQEAAETARHEQKMAEIRRESERLDRDAMPDPEPADPRAWMQRGTVLDRVSGNGRGRPTEAVRADAPVYSGMNPPPLVVPPKPSAAEQNAEIERKYGTKR